jgi:hypothetical protein
LDVGELRSAFTLSNTVTERIRAFRTDRIIALSNNETPVLFVEGPKIVIHCIPFESFSGQPLYDVMPYYQNPIKLQPMAVTGWDRRINLEGVVTFGGDSRSYSYTHLYRNGVIEVVQGRLWSRNLQDQPTIPSVAYEKHILNYLPSCLRVLAEIGVSVPIVVALTLTNTRGLRMSGDRYSDEVGYPIEAQTLILPEAVVMEFTIPVGKVLKPLFDLVWNACGYPASKNFDAEGNWINRGSSPF